MTNRPPPPPPRLPADFENRHPLRDRLGPPPIGARRPPPEFPPQMRPVAARPPRETRRAPRRGNGLVKALAYLGVGVLVLGLGAAAFVALAPPVELIRDRVAAEVKARTGRDLVIAGPTSLRLFPAPGVTMSDVKLSAPPGMGGAPTVAMNRLDVSVKFMPLLRQQVVVERIALKDPVFDLRIDANGRKSWQFASASDDGLVRLAQAQPPAGTASDAPPAANAKPPAPKAGGTSAAALEDISIDEVTIENGTVHYTDARSGVQHDASNIEARFKMPSLARALEGEGELAWGGEQMSFKGSVAPVKNLLEGHTAKLALNIGGRPMTVLFNGNLWTKDGVGVDGALDAKFHSLDALAAWLKKPDLAVGNIDSVAIAGQLQATDDQTKLSNATLSLDDVTARGSVIVKRGPQRPLITADLQIAELDLNRFRSDGAPAATAETPAATSQQPGSRPAGDDPIGKLLQQGEAAPPGPRVKGFTQRAGWSAEPYDLKALGLADVDAKLAVGKVRTRTMTMHDTRLRVALKDKVMRTTFDEVHLYDGKGQGFVTIEASENGAARVGANFAFEDISAQPLLRETADIDWLAGKGRLTLALASQGESETQIVDNLNGKAGLVINDGALIGVDIDGALRGLSEGRLDGLRTDPSQKTNFNEMVANFVITNGVAKNDDLRITSPMLQVTGTGLVMLPQREIDYTVRPKVVALQGQSNTAANVVNGLEIPVRIHGDWNKPKFKADVKNVLDNPRTKEAVRDIKRQYKGKSAEDIVNDLMSKDEKGKSKAKKLLDKFLKPDGDE
jgi:AsmA protein